MVDFQFYPTPLSLATKAWAKFRNKNFVRVLEPSAGNGDLIKGMPYFYGDHRRSISVDCCEIDISKHALLRSLPGVSIVGVDFMELGNSGIYSHVIQNPPFATGVHHVLKAWDGMFDGEIVSIINAATIKNPNSREKEHLVRLIKQFGDVEFVEEAFIGDDVERKTKVEVAIVYLRKQSNIGEFIVDRLIGDLQNENEQAKTDQLSSGFQQPQELAVPTTVIENLVSVFDSAVKFMRDAVFSQARSNHYSSMIGATMAELSVESAIAFYPSRSIEWVKSEIAAKYLDLKDRSWANLLKSSKVKSQLSSTAIKRMEAAFADIKTLEFTVNNIQAFLRGLVENQNAIMLEMACDIFDSITRYHTDNIVFYKGWVSNDKQRTCGMRIKKTRFILPFNTGRLGDSLSWGAERQLADFDRVLSMLDGKDKPDNSLVEVFKNHMKELRGGARVASSYLDVRYYPGAETIHLFPRDQELMDKLNRLVGEFRKWLPPKTDKVSSDFLRQYDEADKFDKEIRANVDKAMPVASRHGTNLNHPIKGIFYGNKDGMHTASLDAAMTVVHERHGISAELQLAHEKKFDEQEQLLLIAI